MEGFGKSVEHTGAIVGGSLVLCTRSSIFKEKKVIELKQESHAASD